MCLYTVGLIFFSCAVLVGVLFLLMARNWRSFIRKFSAFEAVFLRPPYYLNGWRLGTKLRSTACVILVCAIVEHLLFLSSEIYTIHLRILHCGLQADNAFVYFAETVFGFIYKVFPFNFVLFFVLEAINVAYTFGWNYIDLFIIMLSITLMTRFGQINARLNTVRGKVMPDAYWYEVRSHFVTACELLEFLDRSIGKMIVLSSLNNLYFICFQLLNIYT
jgi:gustatory receptor